METHKRKGITENETLILLSEVEKMCPLCPKTLMYEKNNQHQKGFEIAHIYPLHPKPEELVLLGTEEKLSVDPNHLHNLICLCVDCHTKFDKPRSVDDYRKLVAIKKKLLVRGQQQLLLNNSSIEDEVIQIIEMLCSEKYDLPATDIIEYSPKEIDDKVNNSITSLTKRKIHRNVQDYFPSIRNKFIELDKLTPLTTETISTQVKAHYLLIKKKQPAATQKEIFDGLVMWLTKQTKQEHEEAAEVIISYFIQNCEVF